MRSNDGAAQGAALKAVARGQVQGVSFRYFIMRHAFRLGLKGYVRNLPDGVSVEVYAEGHQPSLKELLAYLRQGPPQARVGFVEEDWTDSCGGFTSFDIIH